MLCRKRISRDWDIKHDRRSQLAMVDYGRTCERPRMSWPFLLLESVITRVGDQVKSKWLITLFDGDYFNHN